MTQARTRKSLVSTGRESRRIESTVCSPRICLRWAALFVNLAAMSDSNTHAVPKWPFFLGDAAMLGLAYFIYYETRGPLGRWEFAACAICVALGAALAVWPFVLDHRARLKQIDRDALGSVSEKLQSLEQIAAQISGATNDWQSVQLSAEKTNLSAREISERMAAEARDFAEFMRKTNDTEKATLRLEVEKLRRAELDWLQVLVHVLDHVHAVHASAVRAGQTRAAEQLAQFRNACHDAARRVGLAVFVPAPGDDFDPQRHQNAESETTPAGAKVGEIVAAGFTFQGRLVRPAAVRVAAQPPSPPSSRPPEATEPGPTQLTLETPG